MRPKVQSEKNSDDLFRSRLNQIINLNHELVQLSKAIDWSYLEEENAKFYGKEGRPGVGARLIIGIHLLKYMYKLSDEGVCERWVYHPYFQYFCGETYFQHELDMERSSMTHWRHRVGDKFCEKLIQESLNCAYQLNALKIKDVEKVVVDTTVQPKAITHPTDAKLYQKAINALGKAAKEKGIELRQSYTRVSKQLSVQIGRYLHAKQMKRAKKSLRKLKTYLGRLIRDITRTLNDAQLREYLQNPLEKAQRIFHQKKEDSGKLYSWHAPEVECISKGKAHKPYEFGCKVSITTNLNAAPAGHFILHAKALHGRPYDGHTLKPMLEEMTSWVGKPAKRVYVDKGYQGHDYPNKHRVFKSGQKRGITKSIKQELRRRSVIEPIIGHVKHDHKLERNYLLGTLGDKMNTLLAGAGYNFRLILKWLRDIFYFLCFSLFFTQHLLAS